MHVWFSLVFHLFIYCALVFLPACMSVKVSDLGVMDSCELGFESQSSERKVSALIH